MNARMERHGNSKSRLSKAGLFLIILGLVVVSVPLLTIAYGQIRQELLLRQAEAEVKAYRDKARKERAANAALMKTTPKGKSGPWPQTKIVIPKLNVEQVVQEGIAAETLTQSPGHYPDSVNPGQTGWCAIAGHRITFSAPFDRLDELVKGDKIILETPEARFTFLFDSIITVADSAGLSMPATNKAHVILTTCEPKTGSTHRLIARGTLAPYPASRYLVPPKPLARSSKK